MWWRRLAMARARRSSTRRAIEAPRSTADLAYPVKKLLKVVVASVALAPGQGQVYGHAAVLSLVARMTGTAKEPSLLPAPWRMRQCLAVTVPFAPT